jgi:hypothetical protein
VSTEVYTPSVVISSREERDLKRSALKRKEREANKKEWKKEEGRS